MREDALSRGFAALVLTNAMKPMAKCKPALLRLKHRYGEQLTIRVSIDDYGRQVHELERGKRSWAPTIDGLVWLRATAIHSTAPAAACRESWKKTSAPALPSCSQSSMWRSTPRTRLR